MNQRHRLCIASVQLVQSFNITYQLNQRHCTFYNLIWVMHRCTVVFFLHVVQNILQRLECLNQLFVFLDNSQIWCQNCSITKIQVTQYISLTETRSFIWITSNRIDTVVLSTCTKQRKLTKNIIVITSLKQHIPTLSFLDAMYCSNLPGGILLFFEWLSCITLMYTQFATFLHFVFVLMIYSFFLYFSVNLSYSRLVQGHCWKPLVEHS